MAEKDQLVLFKRLQKKGAGEKLPLLEEGGGGEYEGRDAEGVGKPGGGGSERGMDGWMDA